jgi:GABA permease
MRRMILRDDPEKLVVRMWLFPYLTWATIAMILFVLVYMLTDHDGRKQVLFSLLAAAVVIAIALVRDRAVRAIVRRRPSASHSV